MNMFDLLDEMYALNKELKQACVKLQNTNEQEKLMTLSSKYSILNYQLKSQCRILSCSIMECAFDETDFQFD